MTNNIKFLFLSLILAMMISSSVQVKFRKQVTGKKHNLVHAHHMSKSNYTPSVFTMLSQSPRFKQVSNNHKKNRKIANLQSFRFKESLGERTLSESHLTDIVGEASMRGWAKFLIMDGKNRGPFTLEFFLNHEFDEQSKRPFDEEAEDQYGPINIQDKTSFFFILTQKGLYVLSSRRNQMTKSIKSLNIGQIKPIVKTLKGFQGGLEDLGNFREGFCFKVISSDDSEWVICSPKLTEKETWMNAIKQIKGAQTEIVSAQKVLEGQITLDEGAYMAGSAVYDQLGPEGDVISTKIGVAPRLRESVWETLQDWSSCTLVCGGGTQTMQRVCKLGTDPEAAPCKGEAVMTKPCNTMPCPPSTPEEVKAAAEEELPMIVKMARVSQRPQRFETCIIKEGDMDIVRADLGNFERPVRIPSRVVLNNMTLSVFQTTTFDAVLFSEDLSQINLEQYPEDEACFKIAGSVHAIVLCSLPTVQGISMKQNRDEWVKQIGFFKDNCYKKLQQEKPDLAVAAIKQAEYEEEVEESKYNASQSGQEVGDQMNRVAGMAVDALQKETKYEKLAEKEELDREVLEELTARKNMEALKAANECLARDERKAEQQQRKLTAEAETVSQIETMKGNIKSMVMNQRANSSKKIAMMKKLADKKKRASAGDMQQLRMKMAKIAMSRAKMGDALKCDPAQPTASKTKYCNTEFDTDPDLNKDCKDPEQFCLMCCENEIGLRYMTDRNACIKKCGLGSKKSGDWVWVPESNQVKGF